MNGKIIALALAFALGLGTAHGEAVADFYRSKTVKLVVGSGVGAGYDLFARATARHIRLPGNPTIIVQNMPGAGGLTAANWLYSLADKDGTIVGLINRYTVVQAVVGNERARYDVTKFTWLGTPASYAEDPYILIVRSDNPLKTVRDIREAKKPLIIGNEGSDVPHILGPALGMNVKVIEYGDKKLVDLALARGEVDSMSIAYANLRERHPDWLKTNFIRPLVQFVDTRTALLPDVVASSELVSTPEQKSLLDFVQIPLAMAYPFVLPPGLPADRVAAIRKAMDDTFKDPAFRADVEKQGLAFSPRSAEEVTRYVTELVQAPKSAVQRYRELVGIRGSK